jgi:hypothetical protein
MDATSIPRLLRGGCEPATRTDPTLVGKNLKVQAPRQDAAALLPPSTRAYRKPTKLSGKLYYTLYYHDRCRRKPYQRKKPLGTTDMATYASSRGATRTHDPGIMRSEPDEPKP